MTLKNIVLIALLLTCLQSASGQKIHFGNSSNVWSFIDSTTGCCIPYPVHYTTAQYEDSLVYNGRFYRYLTGSVASVLIREDSGRVYVIGTSDSTERILYDFNLALSDTLRIIYPEDTFTAWVTAIDSTQIAGNWYKVWHFDGEDASTFYPDSIRPFAYNVIEGIGCTNGPYYPASPYTLAAFSQQLLCFKDDTGVGSLSIPVASFGYTYTQSFDNSISCDSFTAHYHVSSNHTAVTAMSIPTDARVIPNPIASTGKIVFPYNITGMLTVTNAVGKVVYKAGITDNSEQSIPSGLCEPGIYYYRVTDATTGKSFTGKLIHQ